MSGVPVIARLQYSFAEVVVEIPAVFGDAARMAARMRAEGLAARKVGKEVIVNGNAEFTPP